MEDEKRLENNSSILKNFSYEDLFEKLKVPVILFNSETLHIEISNTKAKTFFSNLNDLSLLSFETEENNKNFNQWVRRIKRSFYSHSFSLEFQDEEGKTKYLLLDGCLLEGGKFIQVIFNDQTELVQAKKEVEQLSITDAMTEMFNFRYFKQNLEKDFDRSFRHGEDLSLILFDVDNFKHYNDTNGHPAGDALLKELGQIIKKSVRKSDVACRYGGEEFVVLCNNTDVTGALIIAEKLRKEIESHPFKFAANQPLGKVSVSIGISSLIDHDIKTSEDMKKMADEALYEAKQSGRNQVKTFNNLKKAV